MRNNPKNKCSTGYGGINTAFMHQLNKSRGIKNLRTY